MPAAGLSVRDKDTQSGHSNSQTAIIGGVVGGVLGLVLIAALVWFGLKEFKAWRLRERQQTADPFPYDDWRRNLAVAEVSRPLLPDQQSDGKDDVFDPNKLVSRSWTVSTAYSKNPESQEELDLPYLPSPAPYLVSPSSVHARSYPGRRNSDDPEIPSNTLPTLPSPPFTSDHRSRSISPKCLPRLVIPSLCPAAVPAHVPYYQPPVASRALTPNLLIPPSVSMSGMGTQPPRALTPNRPPSMVSISYEHPAHLQPGSNASSRAGTPSGHRPRSVLSVASQMQLYNPSVSKTGTPPVGSSFTRRS
ncbi:hypothetical protein BDZ89DRAFT_1076603 [Hymenopellis radicata]|nr:hypothetical protein BDZ89DRAFT_1076603 [Hymenopellis radicata]